MYGGGLWTFVIVCPAQDPNRIPPDPGLAFQGTVTLSPLQVIMGRGSRPPPTMESRGDSSPFSTPLGPRGQAWERAWHLDIGLADRVHRCHPDAMLTFMS